MKRKLLPNIPVMILAVLSFCSSAGFSQSASKQMATIPFTFVFEGLTLPPGTYEIDMMDSGMFLLLDSKEIPIQGEAATLPLLPKGGTEGPKLIFVNSPEGYRLVEVRTQKERRLFTSDYGHGKFIGQQLRTVSIVTLVEKPPASPQQASSSGR